MDRAHSGRLGAAAAAQATAATEAMRMAAKALRPLLPRGDLMTPVLDATGARGTGVGGAGIGGGGVGGVFAGGLGGAQAPHPAGFPPFPVPTLDPPAAGPGVTVRPESNAAGEAVAGRGGRAGEFGGSAQRPPLPFATPVYWPADPMEGQMPYPKLPSSASAPSLMSPVSVFPS